MCRTHEQGIDRKISEAINVPIPPNIATPARNTEMATAPQDQSAGDGGYQTVVIAVLAIALLGTATGWIVTCIVAWRRSSKNNSKLR